MSGIKKWRVIALCGLVSVFSAWAPGLSAPAFAQQAQGESAQAFEAGSTQEQLELDLTPVPVGMGAIFVPSLTDPKLEPPVMVFQGEDRVAIGRTGQRLVVPPGRYRVVVGHGSLAQRASKEIEIIDSVTTPLEGLFGAVRITAVDRDGRPIEQDYIITALDQRSSWGPTRTSEKPDYVATSTWALPEGRYAIALGDDAQREESRFVFTVRAGEVLRYRLVVDDERLLRTEFASSQIVVEPKIFKLSWVIGADGGLERTSRQLTSFNGDTIRLGAFTKASFALDTGNHLAQLSLGLDESWLGLESRFGRGLPLQKVTDEASAELLYNYRLGGILGPYARATVATAFFPTILHPERDTTLSIRDINGDVTTRTAAAGDELRLFDSLNPLALQEGVGLGLTILNNKYLSMSLRGGGAARQVSYNGGLYLEQVRGDNLTLVKLADKQSFGAEATALFGLRLGQTFSYSATFNAFVPKEQVLNDDEFLPVYRLDNNVALSLGRFAALVYTATFNRDDTQIEQTQFRHNLTLRLQHTLF